jgi:hypothetical protein
MIIQNYLYTASRKALGGTVFSKWKDLQVARTKPASVSNPQSVAQTFQRTKFAIIQLLGRLMGPVLDIGLKSMTKSMTQYNAFLKLNINTAVSGATTEDLAVDFPNLTVSKGPAFVLRNATCTQAAAGQPVEIEWNQPLGTPVPANSPAYIAVVGKENGLIDLIETDDVNDGAASWDPTGSPEPIADTHFYLFYKNAGTNAVCDSIYLHV